MKKRYINYLFLYIPILILNIISLFNMYNAKLISSSYNHAFLKQFIFIIIGTIVIFISKKIKITNHLYKLSKYLYLFSLILLILVLFIGSDINGAKCWLSINGLSFQPSEFMKLSLIIYFISILKNTKLNTLIDEFKLIIKYFILTIIPSILVFLEPDTGAIINYLIILFIFLLFIKLHKCFYITFFTIFFIFILSFFIMYFNYQDLLIKLIGTSLFYRMDRIINFASGSSYQLENALISIGASSFFGVGLNKILIYIPEAPTDFIFAFSIGNFGIFNAILIILCYLSIDIYLIIKTNKLSNKYSKLFIYSYLSLFIFHQIYNIFMNIGLLPIMGIPLPLLSYGGTNTLINYLFLAISLNFLNEKNT